MSRNSGKPKKFIDIDEFNCSICQENYDNFDRNPRMIMCGHTFCTACLRSILSEDDPLCPDCRSEINFLSVEFIPICYLVKKIIETVNGLNKQSFEESSSVGENSNEDGTGDDESGLASVVKALSISEESVDNSLSDTDSEDEEIPYNGHCSEHKAPNHLWCRTCKLWICGTCAFLEHQNRDVTTAQSLCNVVISTDFIDELQELKLKQIGYQKTILTNINNNLNSMLTTLDTFVHFGLRTNTTRINEIVIKRKHIRESIDILDDVVEMIEDSAFNQWRKTVKYIDNLFAAQHYPMIEEDVLRGFLAHFITEENTFDDKILDLNRNCVMLSCTVGSKKKYGILLQCQTEKVVYISSLREMTLPTPTPIVFHLSDLLVPALHTFFELVDEENRYLGRVIFRLFNTERSKQFRMLCSGEKGPSYKGTNFFGKYGTFCQYLSGGDYEYNDGSGGKRLFDFYEDISAPMEEGIVCGNHASYAHSMGQFKIFYSVSNSSINEARGVIAQVVQGLDIIKTVAQEHWNESLIRECGLLLFASA